MPSVLVGPLWELGCAVCTHRSLLGAWVCRLYSSAPFGSLDVPSVLVGPFWELGCAVCTRRSLLGAWVCRLYSSVPFGSLGVPSVLVGPFWELGRSCVLITRHRLDDLELRNQLGSKTATKEPDDSELPVSRLKAQSLYPPKRGLKNRSQRQVDLQTPRQTILTLLLSSSKSTFS